jgi:hypothetical protein
MAISNSDYTVKVVFDTKELTEKLNAMMTNENLDKHFLPALEEALAENDVEDAFWRGAKAASQVFLSVLTVMQDASTTEGA